MLHGNIDDKYSEFLKAFEECRGIVTDTCLMVGMSRQTYYRWREEDPEFKAACDEIGETVIDFAENSLHKLIKDENPAAVMFYLKTKGRKRGYVEKVETVNHNTNDNLNTTLTLEERETIKGINDIIESKY